MSGRTGAREERDLIAQLREQGFESLRIPASGAGTNRELPDVLTKLQGPRLACIEAKYTSGDYVYVEEREIEELLLFANAWEAIPVIAVRFSHDRTWYGIPARDIPEQQITNSGNLSLKRDRRSSYPTLERLLTYYSAY